MTNQRKTQANTSSNEDEALTMAIPEGWKRRTVGSVLEDILSGTSVHGEDRTRQADEPGVLKLSCLTPLGFDPSECKAVGPTEVTRLTIPVRGDTILMSRKNTASLVGASAYVPHDVPGLFLPDLLWLLVPRQDEVHPRWLAMLLGSATSRRRIAANASGTSGSMKGITKPSLRALEFDFPSLSEQRAIVTVLEMIDGSVQQVDRLAKMGIERKRAAANLLLSGSSGIAAGAWRSVPLGMLLTGKDQRAPEPSPIVLSCSKMYGILPQSERFKSVIASSDLRRYKWVIPGDLVYDPMLLWDASIAFSNLSGVVSPAYETLTWIGDGLGDPRFFRALFQTQRMRQVYKTISQGTNARRRKAPLEDFLRVTISLPPLNEQRRIADLLALMDEEIVLLHQERDALRAQKNGLLQSLLTGEIRLPEFRS